MAIEGIGGVATEEQYSTSQTDLAQEDLLEIMLAQLNYQDPLEPIDNDEFMAQLAQFSSLDQVRQINEKVDYLLTVQAAQQSIGLLNRSVDISTETGLQAVTVQGVEFDDGIPLLTVRHSDGSYLTGVRLSQVSAVR